MIVMMLLTGVIYPLSIYVVGRLFFKDRAEGSLVIRNGSPVGSKWIGQSFHRVEYFWSRPSAVDYNPLPSGGSNLSRTSRDLEKVVADRRQSWDSGDVPPDLLYASGSGLDPHLSPEGAHFQVDRIRQSRGLSEEDGTILHDLVTSLVEGPDFGVLGQPRVNVLLLNLELDQRFPLRR